MTCHLWTPLLCRSGSLVSFLKYLLWKGYGPLRSTTPIVQMKATNEVKDAITKLEEYGAASRSLTERAAKKSNTKEQLRRSGRWMEWDDITEAFDGGLETFEAELIALKSGTLKMTKQLLRKCNGMVTLSVIIDSTAVRGGELPSVTLKDFEAMLASAGPDGSATLIITNFKTEANFGVKTIQLPASCVTLFKAYAEVVRPAAFRDLHTPSVALDAYSEAVASNLDAPFFINGNFSKYKCSDTINVLLRELTGQQDLHMSATVLRKIDMHTTYDAAREVSGEEGVRAMASYRGHSLQTAERYYQVKDHKRDSISGFSARSAVLGSAALATGNTTPPQRQADLQRTPASASSAASSSATPRRQALSFTSSGSSSSPRVSFAPVQTPTQQSGRPPSPVVASAVTGEPVVLSRGPGQGLAPATINRSKSGSHMDLSEMTQEEAHLFDLLQTKAANWASSLVDIHNYENDNYDPSVDFEQLFAEANFTEHDYMMARDECTRAGLVIPAELLPDSIYEHVRAGANVQQKILAASAKTAATSEQAGVGVERVLQTPEALWPPSQGQGQGSAQGPLVESIEAVRRQQMGQQREHQLGVIQQRHNNTLARHSRLSGLGGALGLHDLAGGGSSDLGSSGQPVKLARSACGTRVSTRQEYEGDEDEDEVEEY